MNRYTFSAELLLAHLNEQLLIDKGFPDAPSWGYAFTLCAALEANQDIDSNLLAQKALLHFQKQDKSDRFYSWEFVVYALNRASRLSSDPSIHDLLVYREKGTRMINWTLLRHLNRSYFDRMGIWSTLVIRGIKTFYTLPSGQILDEFKTRSLQYHAFCLFVLAELDQTRLRPMIKPWLIRGCQFALTQILDDGMALYIGRGQEQIFGYGALIFALEYASARYQLDIENKINAIWLHVHKFQREDGSYPLVLREQQMELPDVSFRDDRPHGWFGYNTLYDYQPFLAYCLLRADKFRKGEFC